MERPQMAKKDIIVLQDLLLSNAQAAAAIRAELESRGILAVNLMSSPGAGKTTLLERIADRLRGRLPIAVIEGDIETERDAERIRAKGVPAWQITTGGACHLEAKMIGKVLPSVPPETAILFIENVGNLVCPASYDLGERLRLVLLSVPEGDDKPKKYPKAFTTAHALVLTKSDLLPHVPFDAAKAAAEARELNPRLEIFLTSAVTGEGLDDLLAYLERAGRDVHHA
jgi:hydrogenase nickel incorporation protein HypB